MFIMKIKMVLGIFIAFILIQIQVAVMIVSLEEVKTLDPSILELHDLPYDWCAKREAIGEHWITEPYEKNIGEY